MVAITLNAADLYQTTADLNLRSGPGSKYNSIGVVKNGENVSVIEKSNPLWFKVEHHGKNGFLSSKFLTLIVVEPPKAVESPKIEPKPEDSDSLIYYVIVAVIIITSLSVALIVKLNPIKTTNKYINNLQKENEEKEKLKKELWDKNKGEVQSGGKKETDTKNENALDEVLVQNILKNIKITVTTSSSTNSYKDDSIIDVTGNSYQIKDENNNLVQYENEVPFWKHHYVYSYSEINSATSEQKEFYNIFKYKFLQEIYLDLKGNTNYSFILLYDFLNEYENHKDLVRLKKQFDSLGKHYYKTESYAKTFLIKKMEQVGDEKGVERLRSQDRDSNSVYTRDYTDDYHLGKQYKDKLNLSTQEVSWLNKFWNPTNVFLGIEGCCIETIKLYLSTLKELNKQLKKKKTTIAKEVEFFQAEIQKFYQSNNTSYYGGYDNSYLKERAESEVFCTVFKRAENTVREAFGHKRKISGDFPYSNQPLVQEFENRIGLAATQIIQSLASSITPPNEITEEELNTQNVHRWKIKFEQLEKSFSETNKQEFINGIYALEKGNQKNPSIENIFFEASKFIAKFDKPEALKFYIYYLYYDLKSDRIDNKQLTKTIQKNLFKTNEQLNDFSKVVAGLVKTKDLKKALEDVSKIYQTKRRKIQLDVSAIKEVQQQDQGTVELLNEYLKDEFEDENTTVKTQEINNEEIKLDITSKTNKYSIFATGISFNEIQSGAIALFAKKSFCIPFHEIDAYCKSRGVFKNQLVDSINENCYEVLDDVLIEEDGNNYTLNQNYYQRITVQ